jgi:hypothetical protein
VETPLVVDTAEMASVVAAPVTVGVVFCKSTKPAVELAVPGVALTDVLVAFAKLSEPAMLPSAPVPMPSKPALMRDIPVSIVAVEAEAQDSTPT